MLALSLYSVSQTGVLVYRSGTSRNTELGWFDCSGKQLGTVGPPGVYANPSLSPDGKRFAVGVVDMQARISSDIWVFYLTRDGSTRLTFDPSFDASPIWSPDGNTILFDSSREGPRNLYQKAAGGAGSDEVVLKSDMNKSITDWSKDGKLIHQSSAKPEDRFRFVGLTGERISRAISLLTNDVRRGSGSVLPGWEVGRLHIE